MGSLNSCSFIGNVGKDVESRSLDGGKMVVNFTLAVTEKYKENENTTWINCVAFGKLAEIIEKYVNKGDQLYVNGRLNNRQYEKDGVTKYFTEIVLSDMVMLGSKKRDSDTVVVTEDSLKKTTKASKKQEYDNDLPF